MSHYSDQYEKMYSKRDVPIGEVGAYGEQAIIEVHTGGGGRKICLIHHGNHRKAATTTKRCRSSRLNIAWQTS